MAKPSDDYMALLRGEISSEEYARRTKAWVALELRESTRNYRKGRRLSFPPWRKDRGARDA